MTSAPMGGNEPPRGDGEPGAYPTAVFDVVMGMNRWCYRVLAYVCLMRDEYPPFRLDAGGLDPGTAATPVGGPVPQPEPTGPPSQGAR